VATAGQRRAEQGAARHFNFYVLFTAVDEYVCPVGQQLVQGRAATSEGAATTSGDLGQRQVQVNDKWQV